MGSLTSSRSRWGLCCGPRGVARSLSQPGGGAPAVPTLRRPALGAFRWRENGGVTMTGLSEMVARIGKCVCASGKVVRPVRTYDGGGGVHDEARVHRGLGTCSGDAGPTRSSWRTS